MHRELGLASSALLSQSFTFDSDRLARAFKATFERRATGIPRDPLDGLSDAFANEPAKIIQWEVKRDLGSDPGGLRQCAIACAAF